MDAKFTEGTNKKYVMEHTKKQLRRFARKKAKRGESLRTVEAVAPIKFSSSQKQRPALFQNDEPLSENEGFLSNNYRSRKNVVTGKIEVCTIYNDEFREISEYTENSILRHAKACQLKFKIAELRQILMSDFSPEYNPFECYFDSLPVWNAGDTDYIRQLSDTVTVTGSSAAVWHEWFKKWIIATVACAINPEAINQQMLIFTGGQGAGKTRWLNKLAPRELENYRYTGDVNPTNRDSIVQMSECLLVNMDEMAGFVGKKSDQFKELITKPYIKMRRFYHKYEENMVRRASLVGSTNQAQFLQDGTGSRRCLVFETTALNPEHEVNIGMVWAQALALYEEGVKYWFDGEEIDAINQHNERFNVTTLEDDVIQSMFLPCAQGEEPDLSMASTKVIEYIQEHDNFSRRLSPEKLGKALRRAGFVPRKSNGAQLYDLMVRPREEQVA